MKVIETIFSKTKALTLIISILTSYSLSQAADSESPQNIRCEPVSCHAFQPNGGGAAKSMCDATAKWIFTFQLTNILEKPNDTGNTFRKIAKLGVSKKSDGQELFTEELVRVVDRNNGENIFSINASDKYYIPKLNSDGSAEAIFDMEGNGVSISHATIKANCQLQE